MQSALSLFALFAYRKPLTVPPLHPRKKAPNTELKQQADKRNRHRMTILHRFIPQNRYIMQTPVRTVRLPETVDCPATSSKEKSAEHRTETASGQAQSPPHDNPPSLHSAE
ncbi:unnamed protein product [Gongylonema pulchrum]|uniref:Secreted protein n=1 Tax=Gongylonema pulchrum TaxID=637853 RepID=A0A183EA86_9BILA|nr:unnamed protein product [Gongylonema pulchrum]